jgi:hypothetical protein
MEPESGKSERCYLIQLLQPVTNTVILRPADPVDYYIPGRYRKFTEESESADHGDHASRAWMDRPRFVVATGTASSATTAPPR